MELKSLLMRVKILEEDLDEFLNQEKDKMINIKTARYELEDIGGETEETQNMRSEERAIEFFTYKFNNLQTELWRVEHVLEVQIELEAEDEEEEE